MRTLIDQLAEDAVDLNGVIIPGDLIERRLGSHAFNLVVYNGGTEYQVSLLGTGTAIKFRGRSLLVATQHQLVGMARERVAMLTDDNEGVAITSGGYVRTDPSSESDAYDLIAFDFTEPCQKRPDLRKRFFDLRSMPPDLRGVTDSVVILTGCPTKDQTYDVEQNNHIGIARRHVLCHPTQDQPSDDALVRLRAIKPMPHDPDGMSGGSAFVIFDTPNGLKAHFAGIVVRGGLELFHIIRAGYVLAFLNRFYE